MSGGTDPQYSALAVAATLVNFTSQPDGGDLLVGFLISPGYV